MATRFGTALVLALLALVALKGGVSAHAEFVTASPAPDSRIGSPPAQVGIIFTEDVTSATKITVLGPSGATVSGATTVSGNRATTTVQGAGTGLYTVQWSNVSADDGDAESGSFQFTVAAGAPPPAALPPSGTGMVVDATLTRSHALPLAIVALSLIGGVVLIARRRAEVPHG